MDTIITEKNRLQAKLYEVSARLEQGEYSVSEGCRDSFLSAVNAVLPLAGEIRFEGKSEKIMDMVIEMLDAFDNALFRRDEKTAESVLKAVMENVKYLRRKNIGHPEETPEEQFERQYKVTDRLNLMVQMQDSLAQVKEKIIWLEENQKQLDTQKDAAGIEVKHLQDSNPDLKHAIAAFRNDGMIIHDGMMQYIRYVNEYLRSRDLSQKNAFMLANLRNMEGQLEVLFHNVTQIAFGTPELLGNLQLNRLVKMAEEFRQDMLAREEQSQQIDNVTEKIGNTIFGAGKRAVDRNLEKIRESESAFNEWKQHNSENAGTD